jgi:hypothetical protein
MAKETIEKAAERLAYDSTEENKGFPSMKRFIEGAEWQAERMYSEKDLEEAFKSGFTNCYNNDNLTFGEWFEQFKKK